MSGFDPKIINWIISGLAVSTKGDVPGHEFHGNQYSEGGGSGSSESGSSDSGSSSGAGESSGSNATRGQALPKPKIIAGHEVTNSFVNRKGTALYTLQKPIEESDRGWAIVKTMRRDKDKSAVHYYHAQGKRDEVVKEFEDIKRYEG